MSLYGLPFDGIKGIRAEKTRLEGEEAKLDADVDTLKRAFVDVFGFSLPINLVRVRNNAYSPVMWRDLSKGRKARVLMKGGMTGEVWQRVLSSLPEDKRRVLLEIEFKRIHLSHALGLLQYEITRLKRLAGEFDTWRQLMRDVNQH
jgi:hypothetical protein